MEPLRGAHLIDGRFHCFTASQRQRLGDIADAKTNQCRVGIGSAEGFHPTADLREQISRLEFEVVAVDLNHGKAAVLRASSYIRCS